MPTPNASPTIQESPSCSSESAQPWTDPVTAAELDRMRRFGHDAPHLCGELIETHLAEMVKWARTASTAKYPDFRERDLATMEVCRQKALAYVSGIAESKAGAR